MSNEDPVNDSGGEHPIDDSGGEYTVQPREDTDRGMDPELLNILLSLDDADDKFISDEVRATGYVDVIAELADPDEEVDGLTVVQKIGQIVTGTLDLRKIKSVHRHPNVIRLEQSRKLYPMLDRSVYEIRAHREQVREGLPSGATPFDGSRVIVGVIDHDCDFAHPNFCKEVGSSPLTRILFLWDQRGDMSTESPEGYPYGREFPAARINEALTLQRPEAYRLLDYTPIESHGTHVLDIAAGNGQGTRNRGVAPCADIIFVHLATENVAQIGNLGNSRRLVDAVKYIFDKADQLGQAAVINISVNARIGPHDGSTLVEKAFDDLLQTPERAIVIAAGNWRTTDGHASGTLKAGRTRRLQWIIRAHDQTPNEMEIWYGGEHEIELRLRSPSGEMIGHFALGTVTSILHKDIEVGRISHGESYTDNGDNVINLFFSTAMEAGRWELQLCPVGESSGSFHAWIAGDTKGQSRFAPGDVDPSHTLGTIACGKSTIVVGSYNPLKPRRAAGNSSAGPTRDGRLKPEVSAPGESINVAKPLCDDVIDPGRSGTSLAAPHVAGSIALLLQTPRGDGFRFADDIRDAAICSARRGPPHGSDWSPRYGHGRFNALSTLLVCSQGMPGDTT